MAARRGAVSTGNRLDASSAARLTEGPALSLRYRGSHGSPVGIVHLGIGAFHRAHQAVYTEDAMLAADDRRWGICGVTQRSAAVRDQLGPQQGLYGVLQRSSTEPTTLRITGIFNVGTFTRDVYAEVKQMTIRDITRLEEPQVVPSGWTAAAPRNRASRSACRMR